MLYRMYRDQPDATVLANDQSLLWSWDHGLYEGQIVFKSSSTAVIHPSIHPSIDERNGETDGRTHRDLDLDRCLDRTRPSLQHPSPAAPRLPQALDR